MEALQVERPRILILSGSLGCPSHSLTTLLAVRQRLDEAGARTDLWDVRDRPLPVADPRYQGRERENPNPITRKLVELADASDGFVIGSPVYHNSYSGALKNALDNLGPDQMRRKPVALVSNGGGMRSVQPLDHLRIVLRAMGTFGISTHAATTGTDFIEDALSPTGLQLVAPDVLARIDAMVEELLWFVERLR
jgi:NAD(P)H-dependent FMN reductase